LQLQGHRDTRLAFSDIARNLLSKDIVTPIGVVRSKGTANIYTKEGRL
jgi:hypothetical protein